MSCRVPPAARHESRTGRTNIASTRDSCATTVAWGALRKSGSIFHGYRDVFSAGVLRQGLAGIDNLKRRKTGSEVSWGASSGVSRLWLVVYCFSCGVFWADLHFMCFVMDRFGVWTSIFSSGRIEGYISGTGSTLMSFGNLSILSGALCT